MKQAGQSGQGGNRRSGSSGPERLDLRRNELAHVAKAFHLGQQLADLLLGAADPHRQFEYRELADRRFRCALSSSRLDSPTRGHKSDCPARVSSAEARGAQPRYGLRRSAAPNRNGEPGKSRSTAGTPAATAKRAIHRQKKTLAHAIYKMRNRGSTPRPERPATSPPVSASRQFHPRAGWGTDHVQEREPAMQANRIRAAESAVPRERRQLCTRPSDGRRDHRGQRQAASDQTPARP